MPKYQIIITRDITTSATLDVVAENEEQAREETIIRAWNSNDRDLEWQPDDVDWTHSEPYVTDITELD